MSFISIHAPKRERRLRNSRAAGNGINFNPRSQTGATDVPTVAGKVTGYFNPRSQTGATTPRSVSSMPMFEFQSTLPNGSDVVTVMIQGRVNISIHAPKRERLVWDGTYDQYGRFQSTLPNGSDRTVCRPERADRYFNPRSQTGAT